MPAVTKLVNNAFEPVPDPAGVTPAPVAVTVPGPEEPRHEPTVVIPPGVDTTMNNSGTQSPQTASDDDPTSALPKNPRTEE